MFTIAQIKEAHSKVKSGADFPNYVQEIIKLGVQKYDYFVSDGHSEYFGKDNYKATSDLKYPEMEIAEKGSVDFLKIRLKAHQNGETDFLTFCKEASENGVEKWTVDTVEMTCVYYDKSGNKMIVEIIPG